MGAVLWSAHYHEGQTSQSYRIGCRARTLLEGSNEIGRHLVSRWFDAFEGPASRNEPVSSAYLPEFSSQVLTSYRKLAAISEKNTSHVEESLPSPHLSPAIGHSVGKSSTVL